MPSRTIRPTQAPAPAPFTYTVGTAAGLAAQAVFAQWDGTGAGGDFLPCASFYNAEGVLLDRAFPDSGPVTAGDTAEVSYRPFKRGGGGGSSATATGEWGFGTLVTVAPGAGANLPINSTVPDGPELLDIASPFAPAFLFAGVYIATLFVEPAFPPGITAGRGFTASLFVGAAPGLLTTVTSPVGTIQGPFATVTLPKPAAVGDVMSLGVQHNDTVARQFQAFLRLEGFFL